MKDWTAYVRWGEQYQEIEIVDVEGRNYDEAYLNLTDVLTNDYEPGWTIMSLEKARPEVVIWSVG